MEKKYTSEMNYKNPKFSAGCVFTEEQWVAKGGKASSLKAHLGKGYITEWEGQSAPVPAAPVQKPETSITVSTSPLEDEQDATDNTSEDSTQEEESAEVVEPKPEHKPKPEGIWDFKPADLEPLPIEALNTMYKDRAAKADINVRAYTDKALLIKKMCSQAAPQSAEEVTED